MTNENVYALAVEMTKSCIRSTFLAVYKGKEAADPAKSKGRKSPRYMQCGVYRSVFAMRNMMGWVGLVSADDKFREEFVG